MDLAQFKAQLGPPGSTAIPTVEAIYATGHWLFEREQFENAAKVFRVMLHAAPRDERGWLALGECHERIGQPRIALELYGAGSVVAAPSARCDLARARALRALDRGDEADEALDRALQLASEGDDADLVALARREKGRAGS
jgi:tetratricopeptide (TPR) repeat protein